MMVNLGETVNFDNAVFVCEQGIKQIQSVGSGVVEIDGGSLKVFNSAVLSILLCWMRQARQQSLSCRLVNLPHRLKEMARVYGLDKLISEA